jgi:phosphatidylglycerophosphate synthase
MTPPATEKETDMQEMTPSGDKAAKGLVDTCVTGIVDLKKRSSFLRRTVDGLPRWVTPNMVTVFRTTLVVPIVCLALAGRYGSALVVFVAAMLLDFVDGALADVRNIKTPLGAFLDPLSDKILVCGTLVALLSALSVLFIPITCGICLIAAALTVVRVAKIGQKRLEKMDQITIAAKPAGKLKCIMESTAIGFILLGLAVGSAAVVWIGGALLTGALVLAGLSLWSQIQGR